MQRILLLIFSFIILWANSATAMTSLEYVSALENRLFSSTFENQQLDKRIDRIEKQIYDNVYTGSPQERLSKIEKIYPQEDFLNTKSKVNSYYDSEPLTQDYQPSDYNNYPIVSKIEQTIYQKDYSGEDIYKRLSRLEKELYGHEKTNLSLQERVENLKSVLPKKKKNSIASAYDGLNYNNQGSGYYDVDQVISELEKGTFRKTFEADDNNKRLSRLEHYYFGQTSDKQSDDERITRLASVAMSEKENGDGIYSPKNAQWAELLINLLIIGLGFLI